MTQLDKKIAGVKRRWPFHSVKPAQVQELEELETELELELEELQKQKKAGQEQGKQLHLEI